MQILLIGATGRTGILVLQEALQRGHAISALVRDPGALAHLTSNQRFNLILIRGSPLNASDVITAVTTAANGQGQLAVISTLNPRRASESPWAAAHPSDSPPRMMADSIAHVLAALANVRTGGTENTFKVVHLAALGVGSSAAQTSWAVRALVNYSNMRLTYADHEAVEAELRAAEGVEWVSVQANRLVEGGESAVARVWDADKGTVGMMATSSREAVAKFLVDAAESREWDGKAPIIVG